MSNYRVRQVLALGRIRERELRLLVALATWMNDDSRVVTLGFDALIRDTGNARNTVKAARDDAASAGRLTWEQPQRGRGRLTVWTVLCLPEKGVRLVDPLSHAGKGVNHGPEKGSTGTGKGGQPEGADLREPDHGLNRLARTSGSSLSRAEDALAAAGATEREADHVITTIQTRHAVGSIRSPAAYLAKAIANGDAAELIAAARKEIAEDDRQAAERRRDAERPATDWIPATSISVVCRDDQHDGCAWSHCRCRCHDGLEALAAIKARREAIESARAELALIRDQRRGQRP